MKKFFSERNIVITLFVMVLITFSLAQEDSKRFTTNVENKAAKNITTTLPEESVNQAAVGSDSSK